MNFVFISPHFPHTYWQFCQWLYQNGVKVLGIADAPYDSLQRELKKSLTEYYRVNSLENYDEVYRAVAYFAFRYGRIDWIESNNEYWLEQDARLRTDFNVPAWIDYWGYDSAHDWAWWRKQIVYFMDHLLTEETVEYVI
ncbi:hypothetical protein [uncultured Prevotella sp.]|uniref:hypothetical protein n=1 Tax=uncultured Prevotella sp. TaxID=159272 RepID=UPI0025CED678|nr:hypothetical protein [uncultured Prevotella sp.]